MPKGFECMNEDEDASIQAQFLILLLPSIRLYDHQGIH